jgi:AcrR family transcriptional regulator
VARWGLAKTTVEDVAREARLSRATVYRHFPGGRDELVDAVVLAELLAFFVRLHGEVAGATSLAEVLERAIPFARREVQGHVVLRGLLAAEPGTVIPKFTIEADRVVAMASGFLLPYLHAHRVAPDVDVHEASAHLARMVVSTVVAPGSWDLCDPDQVASLVRIELLAGLVP